MALTISEVIMRSAIISHLCFTTISSVSHFSALLHGTFNKNLTTISIILILYNQLRGYLQLINENIQGIQVLAD